MSLFVAMSGMKPDWKSSGRATPANSFVGSAHFSMPVYSSYVETLEIAQSAGVTAARRCRTRGDGA
jgi:hypothetical protein